MESQAIEAVSLDTILSSPTAPECHEHEHVGPSVSGVINCSKGEIGECQNCYREDVEYGVPCPNCGWIN
jgi:hypothetical protein